VELIVRASSLRQHHRPVPVHQAERKASTTPRARARKEE
jgi:hypothetical protein